MSLKKKAVKYMQDWGRNCQQLWMVEKEMPPGAENIVNWLIDGMEKKVLRGFLSDRGLATMDEGRDEDVGSAARHAYRVVKAAFKEMRG